jgi:hypothetical protein
VVVAMAMSSMRSFFRPILVPTSTKATGDCGGGRGGGQVRARADADVRPPLGRGGSDQTKLILT